MSDQIDFVAMMEAATPQTVLPKRNKTLRKVMIMLIILIILAALSVGGYLAFKYAKGKAKDAIDDLNPFSDLIPDAMPKCPDGWQSNGVKGMGALCGKCPQGMVWDKGALCYTPCPTDWKGSSTIAHCQHHTIPSSVGADGSKSIPNKCADGEVPGDGLCYKIPSSSWSYVSPGIIGDKCPAGYDTHPLTCFRNAHIYAKRRHPGWNAECNADEKKICLGVCGASFVACEKPCKSGYTNDGLTCRKDVSTINRATKSVIGTLPSKCPTSDRELHGRLCYPKCPTGYKRQGGNLENCETNCPTGFKDIGIGGCEKPSGKSEVKGLAAIGTCPEEMERKPLGCFKKSF